MIYEFLLALREEVLGVIWNTIIKKKLDPTDSSFEAVFGLE